MSKHQESDKENALKTVLEKARNLARARAEEEAAPEAYKEKLYQEYVESMRAHIKASLASPKTEVVSVRDINPFLTTTQDLDGQEYAKRYRALAGALVVEPWTSRVSAPAPAPSLSPAKS